MLLTGSESERRPPEEGSGVSPASNVSHVLGSSATGNPEDAVQQTNVKGQKMGFDMTADAGGTCVTNLISLPVSKLFDSVELTKSEDYDKALSDGLVASRFGCSTESLVCLLAPYVSRLCEVTNRGIDKYLSSRENAFRKVDDELVEFGALVDADAAASAALAASALSGEEAGATDCSLHKNGGEKSVLQQRHHKAVKWSFKKLRWLADEELEGSLAGLEGLVAFKSCVISEAIDASLRQGQRQSRFFWEAPEDDSASPSASASVERNAEARQLVARLKRRAEALALIFVSEKAAPSLLTVLLGQLSDLPDLELPLQPFVPREARGLAVSAKSRAVAGEFVSASDGSPRELRHITFSSNPLSPALRHSSVFESNASSQGAFTQNPFGTLHEREPRAEAEESTGRASASRFACSVSSLGGPVESGKSAQQQKKTREDAAFEASTLSNSTGDFLPEDVRRQVDYAVKRAASAFLSPRRMRPLGPSATPRRANVLRSRQDPRDGFKCKTRLLRFLFNVALEHVRQQRLENSTGEERRVFSEDAPALPLGSQPDLCERERRASQDSRASSAARRLSRRRSCEAVALSSESGHRKKGRVELEARLSGDGAPAEEAAARRGRQRRRGGQQTPESWGRSDLAADSSLRGLAGGGSVAFAFRRLASQRTRRGARLAAAQIRTSRKSRLRGAPVCSASSGALPSERPHPQQCLRGRQNQRRWGVSQSRVLEKGGLLPGASFDRRGSGGSESVVAGEDFGFFSGFSRNLPRKRARRASEGLSATVLSVSEETGRAVCALLTRYALRLVFAAALCKEPDSPPVFYLHKFVAVLAEMLKKCLEEIRALGEQRGCGASLGEGGGASPSFNSGTGLSGVWEGSREVLFESRARGGPPSLTQTFVDGVALPLLYGLTTLANNPWQPQLLARAVRAVYPLLQAVQSALDAFPNLKFFQEPLFAAATFNSPSCCSAQRDRGAASVGFSPQPSAPAFLRVVETPHPYSRLHAQAAAVASAVCLAGESHLPLSAADATAALAEFSSASSAHFALWKVLRFPQATHVVLVFDPLCETEGVFDALTIYRGAWQNCTPESIPPSCLLFGPFAGPRCGNESRSSLWPAEPLVANCCCLTFVFRVSEQPPSPAVRSGARGSLWGFRVACLAQHWGVQRPLPVAPSQRPKGGVLREGDGLVCQEKRREAAENSLASCDSADDSCSSLLCKCSNPLVQNELPVLVELQVACGAAVAAVAAALLRGPPTCEGEVTLSEALSSQLFAGGLRAETHFASPQSRALALPPCRPSAFNKTSVFRSGREKHPSAATTPRASSSSHNLLPAESCCLSASASAEALAVGDAPLCEEVSLCEEAPLPATSVGAFRLSHPGRPSELSASAEPRGAAVEASPSPQPTAGALLPPQLQALVSCPESFALSLFRGDALSAFLSRVLDKAAEVVGRRQGHGRRLAAAAGLMTEGLGGPLLTLAVRAFFCCLLVHLRMCRLAVAALSQLLHKAPHLAQTFVGEKNSESKTTAALQGASGEGGATMQQLGEWLADAEEFEPLIMLWISGRRLRQWVVLERQRSVQLCESLKRERSQQSGAPSTGKGASVSVSADAKEEPSSGEPPSSASLLHHQALASYEYWAAVVLARASLLLRLRPFSKRLAVEDPSLPPSLLPVSVDPSPTASEPPLPRLQGPHAHPIEGISASLNDAESSANRHSHQQLPRGEWTFSTGPSGRGLDETRRRAFSGGVCKPPFLSEGPVDQLTPLSGRCEGLRKSLSRGSSTPGLAEVPAQLLRGASATSLNSLATGGGAAEASELASGEDEDLYSSAVLRRVLSTLAFWEDAPPLAPPRVPSAPPSVVASAEGRLQEASAKRTLKLQQPPEQQPSTRGAAERRGASSATEAKESLFEREQKNQMQKTHRKWKRLFASGRGLDPRNAMRRLREMERRQTRRPLDSEQVAASIASGVACIFFAKPKALPSPALAAARAAGRSLFESREAALCAAQTEAVVVALGRLFTRNSQVQRAVLRIRRLAERAAEDARSAVSAAESAASAGAFNAAGGEGAGAESEREGPSLSAETKGADCVAETLSSEIAVKAASAAALSMKTLVEVACALEAKRERAPAALPSASSSSSLSSLCPSPEAPRSTEKQRGQPETFAQQPSSTRPAASGVSSVFAARKEVAKAARRSRIFASEAKQAAATAACEGDVSSAVTALQVRRQRAESRIQALDLIFDGLLSVRCLLTRRLLLKAFRSLGEETPSRIPPPLLRVTNSGRRCVSNNACMRWAGGDCGGSGRRRATPCLPRFPLFAPYEFKMHEGPSNNNSTSPEDSATAGDGESAGGSLLGNLDFLQGTRGCGLQLERQLRLFFLRALSAVAQLAGKASDRSRSSANSPPPGGDFREAQLSEPALEPQAFEGGKRSSLCTPPSRSLQLTALSVFGAFALREADAHALSRVGVLGAVFEGALPALAENCTGDRLATPSPRLLALRPAPYTETLLLFLTCVKAATEGPRLRLMALRCCVDLLLVSAVQTEAARRCCLCKGGANNGRASGTCFFLSRQTRSLPDELVGKAANPTAHSSRGERSEDEGLPDRRCESLLQCGVAQTRRFSEWESQTHLLAEVVSLLVWRSLAEEADGRGSRLQSSVRHVLGAGTCAREGRQQVSPPQTAAPIGVYTNLSPAEASSLSRALSSDCWSSDDPWRGGDGALEAAAAHLLLGSSNALSAAVALLLACASQRLRRLAALLLRLTLPLQRPSAAAVFLLPALFAQWGAPHQVAEAEAAALRNAAKAARVGCFVLGEEGPTAGAADRNVGFPNGGDFQRPSSISGREVPSLASLALATETFAAERPSASSVGMEGLGFRSGGGESESASGIPTTPGGEPLSEDLLSHRREELQVAERVVGCLLAAIGSGLAVCSPEALAVAAQASLEQRSEGSGGECERNLCKEEAVPKSTQQQQPHLLVAPLTVPLSDDASGLSQLRRRQRLQELHRRTRTPFWTSTPCSEEGGSEAETNGVLCKSLFVAADRQAAHEAAIGLELRSLLWQLLRCRATPWAAAVRRRVGFALEESKRALTEGPTKLVRSAAAFALRQRDAHSEEMLFLQKFRLERRRVGDDTKEHLDPLELQREGLALSLCASSEEASASLCQKPAVGCEDGLREEALPEQPSWINAVEPRGELTRVTCEAALAARECTLALAAPRPFQSRWSGGFCEALGGLAAVGGVGDFLRVGCSLAAQNEGPLGAGLPTSTAAAASASESSAERSLLRSSRVVRLALYEGAGLQLLEETPAGGAAVEVRPLSVEGGGASVAPPDTPGVVDLLLQRSEKPPQPSSSAAAAGNVCCASRSAEGVFPSESRELLQSMVRLAVAAEQCMLGRTPREGGAEQTAFPSNEEEGLAAQGRAVRGSLEGTALLPASRVASLLLLQLRTMALSAVSELLRVDSLSRELLHRHLLQALLLICLRPVAVSCFEGLSELKARAVRLRQLLRDRLQASVAPEHRVLQRLSAAAALPHSPFAALPLLLPSCWSRQSICGFERCPSSWQRLRLPRSKASNAAPLSGERLPAADSADEESLGFCFAAQANRAVPNSLPAFYFEVAILPREKRRKKWLSFSAASSVGRGASKTSFCALRPRESGAYFDSGSASDAEEKCKIQEAELPVSKSGSSGVAEEGNLGSLAVGLTLDGCCALPRQASGVSYFFCSGGFLVRVGGACEEGQSPLRVVGRSAPFEEGDVVGVFWELRRGLLAFSLNGRLVSPTRASEEGAFSEGDACAAGAAAGSLPESAVAFREVRGSFRPSLLATPKAAGRTVEGNFGQRAFAFRLEGLMPPESLDHLFRAAGLQRPAPRLSDEEPTSPLSRRFSDSGRGAFLDSTTTPDASPCARSPSASQGLEGDRDLRGGGTQNSAARLASAAQATAPLLSDAELQRRAAAESLREMMGSQLFPVGLCVEALRRTGDDITAAAEWLLESGLAELEAMQETFLDGASFPAPSNDPVEETLHKEQEQREAGPSFEETMETERLPPATEEEHKCPSLFAEMQSLSERAQRRQAADCRVLEELLRGPTAKATLSAAETDECSAASESQYEQIGAAVLQASTWFEDLLLSSHSLATRKGAGGGLRPSDPRSASREESVLLPPKEFRVGLLVRVHPNVEAQMEALTFLPSREPKGEAKQSRRRPWAAAAEEDSPSRKDLPKAEAATPSWGLCDLEAHISEAPGVGRHRDAKKVLSRIELQRLAGRCGFVWEVENSDEAREEGIVARAPTVVLEILDGEQGLRRLVRLPQCVVCRAGAGPSGEPQTETADLDGLLEGMHGLPLRVGVPPETEVEALARLLEKVERAVAGLQVRRTVLKLLECAEGSASLQEFGSLEQFVHLLQLSYSELGPPLCAAGGAERASTLINTAAQVWTQTQQATAALPAFLPPSPRTSFAAFFLSRDLAASTLLPVPTHLGVGDELLHRGVGGPPSSPHALPIVLQQVPREQLQQLLRLLQLLGREVVRDGSGGVLRCIAEAAFEQLRSASSFRPPLKVVETPHPLPQTQIDLRQRVSFRSCRNLLMLVDPRTDVAGERGTSLRVYRHVSMESELFSLREKARADLLGPVVEFLLLQTRRPLLYQQGAGALLRQLLALLQPLAFSPSATLRTPAEQAVLGRLLRRQLSNLLETPPRLEAEPDATVGSAFASGRCGVAERGGQEAVRFDNFGCALTGGGGLSVRSLPGASSLLLALRVESASLFAALYHSLEFVSAGGFAGSIKLLSGMAMLAAAGGEDLLLGEQQTAAGLMRGSPQAAHRHARAVLREKRRERLRVLLEALCVWQDMELDPLVRRLCGLAVADPPSTPVLVSEESEKERTTETESKRESPTESLQGEKERSLEELLGHCAPCRRRSLGGKASSYWLLPFALESYPAAVGFSPLSVESSQTENTDALCEAPLNSLSLRSRGAVPVWTARETWQVAQKTHNQRRADGVPVSLQFLVEFSRLRLKILRASLGSLDVTRLVEALTASLDCAALLLPPTRSLWLPLFALALAAQNPQREEGEHLQQRLGAEDEKAAKWTDVQLSFLESFSSPHASPRKTAVLKRARESLRRQCLCSRAEAEEGFCLRCCAIFPQCVAAVEKEPLRLWVRYVRSCTDTPLFDDYAEAAVGESLSFSAFPPPFFTRLTGTVSLMKIFALRHDALQEGALASATAALKRAFASGDKLPSLEGGRRAAQEESSATARLEGSSVSTRVKADRLSALFDFVARQKAPPSPCASETLGLDLHSEPRGEAASAKSGLPDLRLASAAPGKGGDSAEEDSSSKPPFSWAAWTEAAECEDGKEGKGGKEGKEGEEVQRRLEPFVTLTRELLLRSFIDASVRTAFCPLFPGLVKMGGEFEGASEEEKPLVSALVDLRPPCTIAFWIFDSGTPRVAPIAAAVSGVAESGGLSHLPFNSAARSVSADAWEASPSALPPSLFQRSRGSSSDCAFPGAQASPSGEGFVSTVAPPGPFASASSSTSPGGGESGLLRWRPFVVSQRERRVGPASGGPQEAPTGEGPSQTQAVEESLPQRLTPLELLQLRPQPRTLQTPPRVPAPAPPPSHPGDTAAPPPSAVFSGAESEAVFAGSESLSDEASHRDARDSAALPRSSGAFSAGGRAFGGFVFTRGAGSSILSSSSPSSAKIHSGSLGPAKCGVVPATTTTTPTASSQALSFWLPKFLMTRRRVGKLPPAPRQRRSAPEAASLPVYGLPELTGREGEPLSLGGGLSSSSSGPRQTERQREQQAWQEQLTLTGLADSLRSAAAAQSFGGGLRVSGSSSSSSSPCSSAAGLGGGGGGERPWRLLFVRGTVSETLSVWLDPQNRLYVQLRVPLQTTTFAKYEAVRSSLRSDRPLSLGRWTHVAIVVGSPSDAAAASGGGAGGGPQWLRVFIDGGLSGTAPVSARCSLCQGALPFWLAPLPLGISTSAVMEPPPSQALFGFDSQNPQSSATTASSLDPQPPPREASASFLGCLADLRLYFFAFDEAAATRVATEADCLYGREFVQRLLQATLEEQPPPESGADEVGGEAFEALASRGHGGASPREEALPALLEALVDLVFEELGQRSEKDALQILQLWRGRRDWQEWIDLRRALEVNPHCLSWKLSSAGERGRLRSGSAWQMELLNADFFLSDANLGEMIGVLDKCGEGGASSGGLRGGFEGRMDLDKVQDVAALFPGLSRREAMAEVVAQRPLLRQALQGRPGGLALLEPLLQFARGVIQLLVSVSHCTAVFSPRRASLSLALQRFRHLLPVSLKHSFLSLALSMSEDVRADGKLRVAINRAHAIRASSRGDSSALPGGNSASTNGDDGFSSSVRSATMQLCLQLAGVASVALRRNSRVWFVAYEGEGGIDAGGLYRDLFTHVAEELQAKAGPLLIPCPNSRGFGENQASGAWSLAVFFKVKTQGLKASPRRKAFLPVRASAPPGPLAAESLLGNAPSAPALFAAWKSDGRRRQREAELQRGSSGLGLDAPRGEDGERARVGGSRRLGCADRVQGKPSAELALFPGGTGGKRALREGQESLCVLVRQVLHMEEEGVGADTFAESFGLGWSTTASDGRVVVLKPSAGERLVQWEERQEYAARTIAFRLAEGQLQVASLRWGLGEVVPLQIVDLLQPEDLQRLVCGSPFVDIRVLRTHTRYTGYEVRGDRDCEKAAGGGRDCEAMPDSEPLSACVQEGDRVVGWFWQVLESFNTTERQQFLRFVWGRSRLPPPHTAWEQEFEITRKTIGRAELEAYQSARLSGSRPLRRGEASSSDGPPTVILSSNDSAGAREEKERLRQTLVDQLLPQSHTCFFQVGLEAKQFLRDSAFRTKAPLAPSPVCMQIDLPPYSSRVVMKEKLLYAITEGIAIDTDNTADNTNWDLELE